MDLLTGGTVSTAGGAFNTNINGMLGAGGNQANTVTVLARNCAGQAATDGLVNFRPALQGTRFKMLGMEVVQATQDLQNSVPLVTGKDTVVRVYLSLEGPTTVIPGVSAGLAAYRPALGATGPHAPPPPPVVIPPLLRSVNAVEVDATTSLTTQRGSLAYSLFFVLPPEWTDGTRHFELSKIYIDGLEANLPCDGCANVDAIGAPRWSHFQPTRPLNIVVAPYLFSRSSTPTPDLLLTTAGALQWLNNVYPLKGNFPFGDGVRILRFLPMRTVGLSLRTEEDKSDFVIAISNVAEDLRDQLPIEGDYYLFGVTPCNCGGYGLIPGGVAFADTWAVENGVVPAEKFEIYGATWAHELAHNMGRDHAGNAHDEEDDVDGAFPYPHGGIGEPGLTVNTEWWIAGPPFVMSPGDPTSNHAHDFMSYGDNSDSHTNSWVSPYTYKALFDQLRVPAQARALSAQGPQEVVVISGRMEADGRTTLRPFHRLTTRARPDPGASGAFRIDLIGPGARVLRSHRFDEERIAHSGTRTFSQFVPWTSGVQEIVIRGRAGVLARRVVSPNAPQVRITAPLRGETWGEKAVVTWQASDADGDALTFSVLYSSAPGEPWLPLANGVSGTSAEIDTRLVPGSRQGRLRVRATDGVNTTIAETDYAFTVPDKAPGAVILSPRNDAVISLDAGMRVMGFAYDAEEGVLDGENLTWTSNRDGVLGHGRGLDIGVLSPGRHVITLTAKDRPGRSAVSRVTVRVEPARDHGGPDAGRGHRDPRDRRGRPIPPGRDNRPPAR